MHDIVVYGCALMNKNGGFWLLYQNYALFLSFRTTFILPGHLRWPNSYAKKVVEWLEDGKKVYFKNTCFLLKLVILAISG